MHYSKGFVPALDDLVRIPVPVLAACAWIFLLVRSTSHRVINMSDTDNNIDLDEIYAFAVQLAKDAGQMLFNAANSRSGTISRRSHVEKESAVDLVTQTDEGKSGYLITKLTCTALGLPQAMQGSVSMLNDPLCNTV